MSDGESFMTHGEPLLVHVEILHRLKVLLAFGHVLKRK